MSWVLIFHLDLKQYRERERERERLSSLVWLVKYDMKKMKYNENIKIGKRGIKFSFSI